MNTRDNKPVSEIERQFGERVATIETDLNSFKDEVRGELRGLSSNVSKLADIITRQGRPNWQVWIGFMGLIFMLVGGGMVFVDMRIENKVKPMQTEFEKAAQEIETQFRASDQIRNTQWSEQQRLNALLWNSGKLGQVAQYPTGPFFQPNVSKRDGE
jgi:hypothetical protein